MLKEKWPCTQLLQHSNCLIAGSGFAARGNLNSQKYCLNSCKYKKFFICFCLCITCCFTVYALKMLFLPERRGEGLLFGKVKVSVT